MNSIASPAGPGLYRNLWRFASGARLALLAGAALLVASQLLRLALPWCAGHAIDVLQVGGSADIVRAGEWIALLVGIVAAAWALHGPGRVLERAVGVRVRRNVSEALFDRLARAPLRWHDRHQASDLQQRMAQASGALDDFAQNQYTVLQSVVTFVGTLAALVWFSPAIGIIAVGAHAVLVLVGTRFDRSMTRLATAQNDAERRYASGVLAFVGNIVTVHALRLQPGQRRLVQSRLEAIFAPLKKTIRLNEAKWCAVDLMSTAITWGVVALYVWKAHGAGAGVMIGGVFMVHQYAEQAGNVVGSAAGHLQNFARTRVSVAAADPIWAAWVRGDNVGSLAADWQRIDLHGVAYRHDAPAEASTAGVGPLALTIRRGARIALVGPSGAGKSTLMRVIAGLYDADQGHLTVDGMTHLGVRPLQSISTFIPQDADVFETTVLQNVVMDREASSGALATALHASAFDDVLATLPRGLDTPVGERAGLSGGQRQRLCLARGFLAAADSSLILLDEPTSALDPLTEAHVYRELDAAFPTAAIIASVHRMGLLDHFDRVVLMQDGQVVDSGTVDELSARQPLFAAMAGGEVHEEVREEPVPDAEERAAA